MAKRERVIKKELSDGTKVYHDNLMIDTKSGIYYWYEMVDGHHFRKSTGTKKISLALNKIKKFRTEANPETDKRVKFNEAFELALKIKEGKSKKTYEEALQGDRRLREWFDDPKNGCIYLDKFVKSYEAKWLEYKTFAYARNMKALGRRGSLSHDRKHLLYVLHRATKNSWIEKKFQASDFELEKYEVDSGKSLEDDEVNRLLKSAIDDFDNERLHLQILIGVLTGMRRGEILGLKVSEINWRAGVFQINPLRIKTRTPRKIPPFIPDDTKALLKKFYDEAKSNGGDCIFPSRKGWGPYNYSKPQTELTNDWDNLRDKVSVDCAFKDLRATCITNMVKERIPAVTIASYLGNSVDMIQKIYDKIHSDLREEIKVLFNGKFYVTDEGAK